MNPIVTAMPVFLTIAAVVGLSILLLIIGAILNPKQRVGPVQKMPYESGMDPIHDTRRRFDVRFHLLAIAFLVFDVELLFLYPWAVALHPAPVAARALAVSSEENVEQLSEPKVDKKPEVAKSDIIEAAAPAKLVGIDAAVSKQIGLATNRHIPFIGAMIFFVLLALGFVYDWRKGIFQWR